MDDLFMKAGLVLLLIGFTLAILGVIAMIISLAIAEIF